MKAGEKAEIPDDFPDDVFIYKPSTVVVSMMVPEGQAITLTTKDDQAKVLDAYASEMEKKGWAKEGSMDMGGNKMLVYKKDERVANVSILKAGNKTQINLTVGAE
jgi:hypothetical protein